MKKDTVWWTSLLLLLLPIALILGGGAFYAADVQEALWKQAVAEAREVTAQGAHAMAVYFQKDQEALQGMTSSLAKHNAEDQDAILNRLMAFSGSESRYFVVDYDHALAYSSETDRCYPLPEKSLATLNFSGSGMVEPFISSSIGDAMMGYYQNFVFADGTRGLIWHDRTVSSIAEEFSLSFYDGAGFSYVVNREGEILLRPGSAYLDNSRIFQNVFDIIDTDGNDDAALDEFRAALSAGESGVAELLYDKEEYVYAFVPIADTTGWQLVTIIPNSAITRQTNEIMKSSQIFVFLIAIAAFIFTTFALLSRRNRKIVMEKETDIRYRDQLFDILANNTDDVYIMLTTAGNELEYISPNVERVLGIPSAKVKGDLSLLEREDDGGEKTDYSAIAAIEPGASRREEGERIHKKTGEHRWFVDTAYRVTIDNADKLIFVLSDQTDEKHGKEALEEALEIARVANQAKSTFLSNMSHDIRTPMNAIVGLCTLLRRDAENPTRVYEHTGKITAASQHLLGLINDVLDMSKIESGKTTLNISEINLAEIVDELGTIMRPQTKAKQQEFDISVVNVSSEHLLGDKLRINQILINILSNAVKYTPVGGHVEMVIRQMPQTTKNYTNLQITVRDNGIGMSPKYLETVFQPFTREVNSTTNKIQGTGLGMAITKNLVELMGGSISVESAVGVGTTFTVNLSLRMLDKEIDQDFWKKYGVTHTLVVDDEAEVCTSIISAMAGTGVSLQYAVSGTSAVQMVEREHTDGRDFDLVLLDWQMPDMDGIETARRIREIIPSDIPIMILTAYDWSEIEEEAVAAGIDGFLSKPFFLSNFKQTIEQVKGKRPTDFGKREAASILAGKRILAVEDNELNSEILKELLDMAGATCEMAENGQVALEKFHAAPPEWYDLILMDVQMPVMNGYEATKAIRASGHPRGRDIPIIAMTANAFAEDVEDALKAGMNAHVAKPIDMEMLEAAIRDIFARREEP